METITTIHEYRQMVNGVCDDLRVLMDVSAGESNSRSSAIDDLQSLPDQLIEFAEEGGVLEFDCQDETTKSLVSDVLREVSKYCADLNLPHRTFLAIESVVSDAPFNDQKYVDWASRKRG